MSLSTVADNIYAFRLARLLTTDWKNWGAYKDGIIDENGKRTNEKVSGKAKANWTFFHRATASLERMMEKVPGGKIKLVKALALFKLFTESNEDPEVQVLKFAEEQAQKIIEAMTGGDSGGDPVRIASGENSGNVVGKNPENIGLKRRKKKKVKSFSEFTSDK